MFNAETMKENSRIWQEHIIPIETERMFNEVRSLIEDAADHGRTSVVWKRSSEYMMDIGNPVSTKAVRSVFDKLRALGFKVDTERRSNTGAYISW